MENAAPWEALFRRAVSLLIETCEAAGARRPRWTFGGGTRLMLLYQHRRSRDIDLFLQDSPQYLTLLSPRVNSSADEALGYVEQSNFLKLTYPEGEIDFIVAPALTSHSFNWTRILGRRVRAETPTEIVLKKVYYRADQFRGRDIFDLATVIDRDRQALLEERDLLLPRKDALLERLQMAETILRAEYDAVDRLAPCPKYDDAVRNIRRLFRAASTP